MINEKKRLLKEQRERERKNRPLTKGEQREYMINYVKSQGNNWKITQLRKLIHDQLKSEFEMCIRNVQKFIPMDSELQATTLKRHGPTLQPKEPKKQKTVDVEDIADIATKEPIKKEEELEVKKLVIKWNIRKRVAKKGLNKSSPTKSDVEEYMEKRVDEPSSDSFTMGSIPEGSTQNAKVVKWQIIKHGNKAAYQIIREDNTDTIYVNFLVLLNDLTRDDLKELYRLMMLKYGDIIPEEEFERVL